MYISLIIPIMDTSELLFHEKMQKIIYHPIDIWVNTMESQDVRLMHVFIVQIYTDHPNTSMDAGIYVTTGTTGEVEMIEYRKWNRGHHQIVWH